MSLKAVMAFGKSDIDILFIYIFFPKLFFFFMLRFEGANVKVHVKAGC